MAYLLKHCCFLKKLYSEAIPDRDNEKDWSTVRRHLSSVFPPVNLPPLVLSEEVNRSLLINCNAGSGFNLAPLVDARKAHETHFAKKAVRVGNLRPEHSITTVTDDSIDNTTDLSPASARLVLAKQIYATWRSAEDGAGSTAGASRRSRHEGKFETVPQLEMQPAHLLLLS